MIRSVLTNSNTSAYALTKAGLAVGASFLGATLVAIVLGWSALGNTHSLNKETRSLVSGLEQVVKYQKQQLIETKEANCKLKLYDILSAHAGSLLFKKLKVLNSFFEKGITHTLEIVESIPSAKVCTSISKIVGKSSKKFLGGLTPSDIEYANKVLGEVLETSMPEKYSKKKIKNHKHKSRNNLEKQIEPKEITPGGQNTVTTTEVKTLPVTSNQESKESQNEEIKQLEKIEQSEKKCLLEIGLNPKILKSEVKICQ